MKKKFFITILSLIFVLTFAVGLSACAKTTDNNETCTVKFYAGSGTIFGERIYVEEFQKNSIISAPSEDPVCKDYFFLGWNLTGKSGDDLWNFNIDKVTQDMTLFAVWVRAYTVTFDADGGTFVEGGETLKVTVADGEKISAPDVIPPDDKHEIKGWQKAYHSYWDFTTDKVTYNITLTADWTYSDDILTELMPFTYMEYSNGTTIGITITGVKDKENVTSLVVPSVVSRIGNNAFKDCVNLETIVIDDSVTYIGWRAFSGCSKLKTVTLPAELTEIEEEAFYGCSSLTAIELPLGVTKIQGNTFRGCVSLEEVKLGANVTELGVNAFMDCASLKSFEIPSGVSRLWNNLFYGCSSLYSITIPATCTDVSQYAFQNSGLVTADIHARKVAIGAFRDCTSLVNLTLGEEVEELGQDAFNGCTSLIEVEIPNYVTKANRQTFKDCTSLKSVVIGNGLTEISDSMFSGCSSLRNVDVGNSVKTIHSYAFYKCISLLSFTIPANVTDIRSIAFSGCARLVEFYNLTGDPNILRNNMPMKNTVIHNSALDESIIDTIDGFSFCQFKELSYPYDESIFLLDYSGNAENLVLPADYKGSNYRIFRYALSFHPQLKSVTFSNGVEAIREEILLGSDNVTTLAVESGNTALTASRNCVIDMAKKKFVLGCKTSIIPTDGSVTTIGSNVFCHNKTIVNSSFKIPESVTIVEEQAFDGIDGIIRTAENYIQYVDKWAVGFDYNSNVPVDLEIDAGTVGIADSAFVPSVNTARIKIQTIKANADLKYIGREAFLSCDFLTEITLNNGLVSIGQSAFGDCSKLEELVIPDSVTFLGAAAFEECTALKYVKLSSSLSVLKSQMFRTCGALKTVVVPTSIVEIESDVFSSRISTTTVNPTVYYEGDNMQWFEIKKIHISVDDAIQTVTVLYYSETEPSTGVTWHFGVDGKPTTQY